MRRQDIAIANWAKEVGLTTKLVFDSKINTKTLQAKKTAHTLLKESAALLTNDEVEILQRFNRKMASNKSRNDITPKQCYAVLNIGKRINRHLFKAYKGN